MPWKVIKLNLKAFAQLTVEGHRRPQPTSRDSTQPQTGCDFVQKDSTGFLMLRNFPRKINKIGKLHKLFTTEVQEIFFVCVRKHFSKKNTILVRIHCWCPKLATILVDALDRGVLSIRTLIAIHCSETFYV